jgi:uncharacterized damage-inducible protein DinB
MPDRIVVTGLIESFEAQKGLAEQAFKQLDDIGVHWKASGTPNTVAILIKHLSGHLRSRFLDFFESDGERADRNKAKELADEQISIDELDKLWNESWTVVFATLNELSDCDLPKNKSLRGQSMTVADYLPRVLVHTAYHTGQIVLLSKQFLGNKWKRPD